MQVAASSSSRVPAQPADRAMLLALIRANRSAIVPQPKAEHLAELATLVTGALRGGSADPQVKRYAMEAAKRVSQAVRASPLTAQQAPQLRAAFMAMHAACEALNERVNEAVEAGPSRAQQLKEQREARRAELPVRVRMKTAVAMGQASIAAMPTAAALKKLVRVERDTSAQSALLSRLQAGLRPKECDVGALEAELAALKA